MSQPLFPRISIDITGPAGNAYAIMGNIAGILKDAGYSKSDVDDVMKDMMSSDYNHLLSVASRYVTIEGNDYLEEEKM